jgi:hypothetical protein
VWTKFLSTKATKFISVFYYDTTQTYYLAIIALDSEPLDKIKYKHIVEDFI